MDRLSILKLYFTMEPTSIPCLSLGERCTGNFYCQNWCAIYFSVFFLTMYSYLYRALCSVVITTTSDVPVTYMAPCLGLHHHRFSKYMMTIFLFISQYITGYVLNPMPWGGAFFCRVVARTSCAKFGERRVYMFKRLIKTLLILSKIMDSWQ